MSDGAPSISPKQLNKLANKAKELNYQNISFFIDDMDMLLRPANLLKDKNMKYFELENLISLLDSKNISLGMAPRMISLVSKYSERNEELESENATLKQSNITLRSKYQTAEAQVKELQNQLKNLSVGQRTDAKIREENIKLTEENKYLKMTNDSLTDDLKKTKTKLDEKLEEANTLDVENSQLELRIKNLQKEYDELETELKNEKKKDKGEDETIKRIEKIIEELDELYESIDDPFKREFVAFMGLELSEIVDNRNITKQKILNQIAIHAREIEKIFEPKIAALQRTQMMGYQAPAQQPQEQNQAKPKEKASAPKEVLKEPEKIKIVRDKPEEREPPPEDSYVKPSEFLKKRGVAVSPGPDKEEEGKEAEEKEEVKPKTTYKKKRTGKKKEPVDRTPSEELKKVFDIFIKYLEAIDDNPSFNDLCDKIIDQLYEHIGSNGMTQVYKIKSGGVKRKQLLIDLIKKWKVRLPDL